MSWNPAPRSSEPRRWFNSSLPQTLQASVMLFYLDAALALISGLLGGLSLILIVAAFLSFAPAFGMANERKWGYVVGVVVASLLVALYLWGFVVSHSFGVIIELLFAGVLLALLLHPQSRSYQRIWFH